MQKIVKKLLYIITARRGSRSYVLFNATISIDFSGKYTLEGFAYDVASALYDANRILYAADVTLRKGKNPGWSKRVSRPKINPG